VLEGEGALPGVALDGAIWVDGTRCAPLSFGACIPP
jgi:hypothetical protein